MSAEDRDGARILPIDRAVDRTLPMTGAPHVPPSGRTPAEGDLLGGRYRLTERLGAGGMGVVYRAVDESFDEAVAVKVLQREGDPVHAARLRSEMRLVRRISHPGVLRVQDLGTDDRTGAEFLVMELVEGRSLRTRLAQDGPLHLERALEVVRQVGEALAAAHAVGVIHRDLKPDNVLEDTGGRVVLSDFGIARSLSTRGMTQTGDIVGTPDYLSPEQARGEPAGERSDLWALGLLLVELLSGKVPFVDSGSVLETLAQRMSGRRLTLAEVGLGDLPPEVEAIVERCLEPFPQDRYPSAEAFLEDLRRLPRPRFRWNRRRRRILAATVAALGVVSLIGWGVVHQLHRRSAAAAVEPGAAPVSPARHELAVLPFSGWEELTAVVSEGLVQALAESPDLRVVGPAKSGTLLADLGWSVSGLGNAELEQVRAIFEVDLVLAGRVERLADGGIEIEPVLHLPLGGQRVLARRVAIMETLGTTLEDIVADLGRELGLGENGSGAVALSAEPEALRGFGLGLSELRRGDPGAAVAAFEQSLLVDPEFAPAWIQLSHAYALLGRSEDAARAARRGMERLPAGSGRLVLDARAQAYLVEGRLEEAEATLQELVRTFPYDVEARIRLAESMESQGKLAEAATVLDRALELDGGHARAWYLRGRLAILGGDLGRATTELLPRARDLFERSGSVPGLADVENALGVAFKRSGNLQVAAEHYRVAVELRRRSGDSRGLAASLQNLATVLADGGETFAAEELLEEALEHQERLGNPGGIAQVLDLLASLAELRADASRALSLYQRALGLRRELGDEHALAQSYTNVGWIQLERGDLDAALLASDRALELYSSVGSVFGELLVAQTVARVELERGRWTEARKTLARALEGARDLGALQLVGSCHLALGRLARLTGGYSHALHSLGQARDAFAEVGDSHGLAAVAGEEAETWLALGDPVAAVEALDSAPEGLPESGARRRLAALGLEVRGSGTASPPNGGAADDGSLLALSIALSEARAERSAGRLDSARAVLQRVYERAVDRGLVVLRLESALDLATVLARSDEAGAGRDLAAGELALARSLEAWQGLWRLEALLSRMLAEAGDPSSSATEASARRSLAELREGLAEEHLARFDRLPGVERLRAGGSGGT